MISPDPVEDIPGDDFNKSVPNGDADVTITVNDPCDENISFPSSCSSSATTPIPTTPTREIPKQTGSPIMRGLQNVLNMFRSSQGPVEQASEVSTPDLVTPRVSNGSDILDSPFVASTPVAHQRCDSTKRSSPLKDSIVFTEELSNELQWNNDSTVLFQNERVPLHKLFMQQPLSSSTSDYSNDSNKNNNVNTSVEPMDISMNESLISDKTITSTTRIVSGAGNMSIEPMDISFNDTMNRTEVVNNEESFSETKLLNETNNNSLFLDCESSYDIQNETELLRSFDEDIDLFVPAQSSVEHVNLNTTSNLFKDTSLEFKYVDVLPEATQKNLNATEEENISSLSEDKTLENSKVDTSILTVSKYEIEVDTNKTLEGHKSLNVNEESNKTLENSKLDTSIVTVSKYETEVDTNKTLEGHKSLDVDEENNKTFENSKVDTSILTESKYETEVDTNKTLEGHKSLNINEESNKTLENSKEDTSILTVSKHETEVDTNKTLEGHKHLNVDKESNKTFENTQVKIIQNVTPVPTTAIEHIDNNKPQESQDHIIKADVGINVINNDTNKTLELNQTFNLDKNNSLGVNLDSTINITEQTSAGTEQIIKPLQDFPTTSTEINVTKTDEISNQLNSDKTINLDVTLLEDELTEVDKLLASNQICEGSYEIETINNAIDINVLKSQDFSGRVDFNTTLEGEITNNLNDIITAENDVCAGSEKIKDPTNKKEIDQSVLRHDKIHNEEISHIAMEGSAGIEQVNIIEQKINNIMSKVKINQTNHVTTKVDNCNVFPIENVNITADLKKPQIELPINENIINKNINNSKKNECTYVNTTTDAERTICDVPNCILTNESEKEFKKEIEMELQQEINNIVDEAVTYCHLKQQEIKEKETIQLENTAHDNITSLKNRCTISKGELEVLNNIDSIKLNKTTGMTDIRDTTIVVSNEKDVTTTSTRVSLTNTKSFSENSNSNLPECNDATILLYDNNMVLNNKTVSSNDSTVEITTMINDLELRKQNEQLCNTIENIDLLETPDLVKINTNETQLDSFQTCVDKSIESSSKIIESSDNVEAPDYTSTGTDFENISEGNLNMTITQSEEVIPVDRVNKIDKDTEAIKKSNPLISTPVSNLNNKRKILNDHKSPEVLDKFVVNKIKDDADLDNLTDPFATRTKIRLSPPSTPSNHVADLNFDEFQNPFATRSKIRLSSPIINISENVDKKFDANETKVINTDYIDDCIESDKENKPLNIWNISQKDSVKRVSLNNQQLISNSFIKENLNDVTVRVDEKFETQGKSEDNLKTVSSSEQSVYQSVSESESVPALIIDSEVNLLEQDLDIINDNNIDLEFELNDDMQMDVDSNEPEELFIDAAGFDFLLNKNCNYVGDNGKESLLLKFDPLCALRKSIDRFATENESEKFEEVIEHEQSNITIQENASQESFEDLNLTVAQKPTMAVMPAINNTTNVFQVVPSTPRSNRHSMTFCSPAVALIDRLLSINTPDRQDMTMTHDVTVTCHIAAENEANDALQQLTQMLAEKEQENNKLRCEKRELETRLDNLESQINGFERINEGKLKKINELSELLEAKTKMNKNMVDVIKEFERTIAMLVADIEHVKKTNAEERMKLISERDEQNTHLASMEVSYKDLYSKFEKCKQVILTCKANEDEYKRKIAEFEESLSKMEKIYEQLKQHATSKLNNANEQLDSMKKSHQTEVIKMKAIIKRKELHISSIEETMNLKTKANEELTAICDELLNRVG